MMKRAHVFARGLVQGVGFRPFIYTIAIANGLKGYVLNLGDAGVEILVEGDEAKLKKFIAEIREKKPSVARVDALDITWEAPTGEFDKFTIAESDERRLTVRSVIPADLGICDLCITDIYRKSRWHSYSFTSCAQCGPRFTMIRKLPYDRENISMVDFPFCSHCQTEYDNPMDRRYDAQGITCPICGPRHTLVDKTGEPLTGEPLSEAAKLLSEGYIVSVKGIGGFHVAVDASNESAVMELRKRRRRPAQPFAVMSRSIQKIRNFGIVSRQEEDLLKSVQRPILTLQKSSPCSLADSISPGLDSIGVMLPYTGIHLLLLDNFAKDALVMTSGNYPGKPISTDNKQALKELRNIADFYLMHNRTIINRCDDSVIKVVEGVPMFLRKSRGYSPSYLAMPWNIGKNGLISVGGEFNVTGSVFLQDRIITTQHIGDISELETLDYLKSALKFITKIYNMSDFSYIAHDLNPSFLTTRYAKELADLYKTQTIPVQHHHAHLASLMADNSMPRDASIVCIAIDGVGYGTDGMAWGGEILLGGYSNFDRVGHLRYQPMPGGDLCAYYPARFLAAILSTVMSDSEILALFEKNYSHYLRHGMDELDVILKQSRTNDALKTSSMGRLLDAIAALMNVCALRTYEGEPPMRLEGVARRGKPGKIALRLPFSKQNGKYIINTSDFMLSLLENIQNKKENITFEAHRVLGITLGELACRISDENGVPTIGLTGGSAVNTLLFKYIKETVERNNKQFLFYRTIPCGDGGTSTGQVAVAAAFQ
ncbi:MAG: carbamoyltransferase HypF [Candidatus Verstraetearchaeota archaeon]|nr:carbamoyltransferase HypF [Candidatus Verstraetearchaeota archaeon]